MSSSEVTSGIRENILVSGSLKNSCVLASCIVRAVKITIPGLETAEYVQAEVALSPPYVPDGDYELYFEGLTIKVRNSGGVWTSEDPRAIQPNEAQWSAL